MTTLDAIPFAADMPRFLEAIHIDGDSPFREDAMALARAGEAIAKPKGVYLFAEVEPDGDNAVTMNGIAFTSRVLRVNLEGVHRAFPFIATCGRELDAWSHGLDDPLQRFWADTLKEMALYTAIESLGAHMAETYELGGRSSMNPGSLEDWPMSEQTHLFALFGNGADTIGVQLTESYLMNPIKSVSGLWFETEKGFVNCQLCPRKSCPNRRAPYNPHLFDKRYRK